MKEQTENQETVSALSIRQPWAELILRGVKKIEIRPWYTSFRGTLYLHTGRKADISRLLEFKIFDAFRGGYVGTIQLAAVVPFTAERWEQWRDQHLDTGQFQEGLYAWILVNPRRFAQPVPGPGELKIFSPNADYVEELKAAAFAQA